MVLHHANTFVAVILLLAGLQSTALANEVDAGQLVAQKKVAPKAASRAGQSRARRVAPQPWYKKMRMGQRWGVGLVSIPQSAYLRSSLGYEAEILTVSSGINISYDVETRINRFIYYGSLGVSVLGVKASSLSDSISYSYGESNYINYMAGMGAYYITESYVRFGLGLRSLYGVYTLPEPSTPGVTYRFNYGSPFKNYLSIDLNWQIYSGLIFGQTLLHPLSKDLATGWQFTLKKSF